MKKIINLFKHVLLGILPAVQGAFAIYDLQIVITYIRLIPSASGWDAVVNCLFALMYLALMFWFLYDLGRDWYQAAKWREYNRSISGDTINSSSCDCETSD